MNSQQEKQAKEEEVKRTWTTFVHFVGLGEIQYINKQLNVVGVKRHLQRNLFEIRYLLLNLSEFAYITE